MQRENKSLLEERQELKARLEAEYDRHWHRVNHGMPTGLVEVVEPRDQWFCVACGLRRRKLALDAAQLQMDTTFTE